MDLTHEATEILDEFNCIKSAIRALNCRNPGLSLNLRTTGSRLTIERRQPAVTRQDRASATHKRKGGSTFNNRHLKTPVKSERVALNRA